MTGRHTSVEHARQTTILRYGGSLWVNGYWPDTIVSIELGPVRRATGWVVLVGPPVASGRSIAVDLGPSGGIETFAGGLAAWLETPSLEVRDAERLWPEVARRIAAAQLETVEVQEAQEVPA